jgi:phospholipase/carboxylesterase
LDDRQVEDLGRLLPPLLEALESLGFIARRLHPPDLAAVLEVVGRPDLEIPDPHARLAHWPQADAAARACLEAACDHVRSAFAGLTAAAETGAEMGPDMGELYKALRGLPRAQEALYPLAAALAPVSRFFLEPGKRGDAALIERLAAAPVRDDTGVMQIGEPGQRGSVSLYVPEDYDDDLDRPLVVALHGGAGSGRSFLWSWLRDARAHGAILAAPTAAGQTWALIGPDPDTPALARLVSAICARWRIDPKRILLTGMSDGGTFSYVSGLEPASPFTHLAPISAAFHPMLAAMADSERLQGLPIHIAHGALDWMFPVEMAREARDALAAAGAAVTYREIADLSHTYPRELNPEILAWLDLTAAA